MTVRLNYNLRELARRRLYGEMTPKEYQEELSKMATKPKLSEPKTYSTKTKLQAFLESDKKKTDLTRQEIAELLDEVPSDHWFRSELVRLLQEQL